MSGKVWGERKGRGKEEDCGGLLDAACRGGLPATGATTEGTATNSGCVVARGTTTLVSLDTVGVGGAGDNTDTTLKSTASTVRVEGCVTTVTLGVRALLANVDEALTGTCSATVSRPTNTRKSRILSTTTGEALCTVRVTATGLGANLLLHTVAAGGDGCIGTLVTAGTVAVLATSHTLSLLACLVTGERLGVTLVLLRVGTIRVFETSHTAVVFHITSASFTVFVGQAGHTLSSLSVTYETSATICVTATTGHTGFGAVADKATTTVCVFVTSDTTLGSCITETTSRVIEGITIAVFATTAEVGFGVTNRTLGSEGATVVAGTVGVVGTLNTACGRGRGLAHFKLVTAAVAVTIIGASQSTLTTCTDLTVGAVAVGTTTSFTGLLRSITDVAQRTVGVGATTCTTLACLTDVSRAVGVRWSFVGGSTVGVCSTVHTLVRGTLEAFGTVLRCVNTLDTLTRAGLTSGGGCLTLSVAGTLGGHTLVALTLLTGLTISVGVTLNTCLAGGVALERCTVSIFGATSSHTLVGFTSLECFTVAVLRTSHTLVLDTNGLGSGGTIFVGATLTGLRNTRVGTDVTELPACAVAVDDTSVTSTAAQLTALLRGIFTVVVALATGLGYTLALNTEGLCRIFTVCVSFTLGRSSNTLTVCITLGSGLFTLRVRLTLRRSFDAGSVVTNGLLGVELLTVVITLTTGLRFAVSVVANQTVGAISVVATGHTNETVTLGFRGIFAVAVGLTFSGLTLVLDTAGLRGIFTVSVLETLRTAGNTLAAVTLGLAGVGTLCIRATLGLRHTLVVHTEGLAWIFTVTVSNTLNLAGSTFAIGALGLAGLSTVSVAGTLSLTSFTSSVVTNGLVRILTVIVGGTFGGNCVTYTTHTLGLVRIFTVSIISTRLLAATLTVKTPGGCRVFAIVVAQTAAVVGVCGSGFIRNHTTIST